MIASAVRGNRHDVPRGGALGLSLAALLAACGGGQAAAPAASAPASAGGSSSAAAAQSSPAGSPAAAAKPASAAPASGQLGVFRSALTTNTGGFTPLWIAIETKGFEQQGVKLETINANTSAAAAALVSDQLDGLFNSSPTMVNADSGGVDLIMVGGMINHGLFSVWAAPSIASPADLKGKRFGCGKAGTPTEFGCLTALKQMGLSPNDVDLLRLDNDAEMYAALTAGQVSASVLQPPDVFLAEHNGYRKIAGMPDAPFQGIGLTVKRSRIPQLRPVITPVLKALQAGIRRYNTDRDFALQVLKKYTKNDDPQFLSDMYGFYKEVGFREDMKVDPAGIAEVVRFASITNPAAGKLKVEDLYDNSFAEGLAAR